jgi:uncharacterized damage-inducible protein DinB
MRHFSIVALIAVLTAAAPAAGQAPANLQPISQAVRDGWGQAKRNLLGSANVMPEAKYSFKPVETVRTFGQILAHVAGANYIFCAAARGEKSPHSEDAFEKTATTRAAIVRALEDSFKYCDTAYAALDDRRAAELVQAPFGSNRLSRAGVLMNNNGHLQEHYGNLVTYLRINGLVPPSSASQ